MVRAFRDLDHEVKVIGPAGEALPEPSAGSRRLGLLKRAIPSALYELLEIAYTAYGFWRTTREIRSFRPDFVYDRYITFNAGPLLAGIACRVPVCLEVNAPLALERSTQRDERLTFRAIATRMERWICSNATRTVWIHSDQLFANPLVQSESACSPIAAWRMANELSYRDRTVTGRGRQVVYVTSPI